jgi:lysophospholipase L1-like esterase
MPSMIRANSLIRDFLKGEKNTGYADVFTPMLTREGNFKPEIYRSDSLHMNAAGYKIWVREIQPFIK